MQSAIPCASLRGPDRNRRRTPAHRSQNAEHLTSRSSFRNFRRIDRGLNNRLSNEYLNRLLYGFLGHQLLPIQRPPRIVEAETSRTNNYPVATVVRVG